MVFPVVMYGCESWTVKKAEHQRTDAFALWCWRRLLRVPWTARRSNQSILKEISPKYSLERLMLKLKLQYFGYLMRRIDSLEKTLMLGKIEGRRRRGRQRMRWLDGITDLMNMNWSNSRSWWWTGRPGVLQSMGSQLSNWTALMLLCWVPSVVSDSLWPHGLQYTRPPCPSPTPRACSNSCPPSRWCHPNILSSVFPFSCLQSFPASGSFPMSQFFASGSQSIGVSALASVLPMNIQDWFPLGVTGWISLQFKGLSRVFSNTRV